MPDLAARFQKEMDELKPGWREGRVIVAYSGGLDSTALLHLAAASLPSERIAAAHLNHDLRPEAEAEQSLARGVAEKLGLAFITDKCDVRGLARERKRGLEEAARRARYDFFARAALAWPADLILTAHQADDQAETMLMGLIKGAGAGGLAGIPPRRLLPLNEKTIKSIEILRPLLPFTRAELKAWVMERNLPWAEDSSNLDDHYLRNALRLNVIPVMEKLNPALARAWGRTARILRGEEEFWAGRLKELWAAIVVEETEDYLAFNRPLFEKLHLAEKRRLIYQGLNTVRRGRGGTPEPLTFEGVETALNLLTLPGAKGLDLPGGVRVETGRGLIKISLASRLKKPVKA